MLIKSLFYLKAIEIEQYKRKINCLESTISKSNNDNLNHLILKFSIGRLERTMKTYKELAKLERELN